MLPSIKVKKGLDVPVPDILDKSTGIRFDSIEMPSNRCRAAEVTVPSLFCFYWGDMNK
jgi:hypothetical protein